MVIMRKAERSSPQNRRIRIPDIAWIEIPAGPFIYQDGESRELPTFWISKYPITNAQFQTFIDDNGYREERWWRALKKPEPETPRWAQPNRPRTDVDWYEAVALTRWLSTRLGLAEDTVRLPTELEWEKAARGEKAQTFPWGGEYRSGFANIFETDNAKTGPWYLDQPIAVGLYPHGSSVYGVDDLCGTVWEWCLNPFSTEDQYMLKLEDEYRVQRGGSWLNYESVTSTLHRQRTQAHVRKNIDGFRVISTAFIANNK